MMFPHPDDIYSSFFPLSPPNINQGSLQDIFSSSSSAVAANNPPQPPLLPPPVEAPPPLTSRVKPTRKDRHRKIFTAKGPRDRRMRLSIDVARKFFDLQDLLAFDKASKTVQWLLNKSKAAIKEHVAAAKRKASSASKCDAGSSTLSDNKRKSPPPAPSKASKRAVEVRDMKSTAPSVKPKVARECRDKARARARERTLEKKKMMMTQCGRQEESSEGRKEPLVFGFHQEESSSHEPKSCLEMVAEMDELCFITSPIHHKEPDDNGSIALFDYNHDMENFFVDSWEMNFPENIDEGVLFGELQQQMSYGTLIIPPVFDQL